MWHTSFDIMHVATDEIHLVYKTKNDISPFKSLFPQMLNSSVRLRFYNISVLFNFQLLQQNECSQSE